MAAEDEDRELRLAILLAEHESYVAGRDVSTRSGFSHSADTSSEELERLEIAKRGLMRLACLWPHEQPREEHVPQSIGRFKIIRELGRGGFGVVYLANDEALGRQVALKVQRPEALVSPLLRERFVREAKAAARLEHVHIARVYDVGEEGFRIWIASEYVPNDSLAAWLCACKNSVSPKPAARFVALLADALEYAHQHGVMHRDLKPSNVLLEQASATIDEIRGISCFVPKLIDFGLAKLDEISQHETRTGVLIGTPPYMAPEQATGKVRLIGPATDVYGLGIVLYELVTGQAAFAGENDVVTLRKVVEEDPVRPRTLKVDIPADLEAIILKCLEKDPAQRYATAAALGADLHRYIADQPTLARPLLRMQRLTKWVRRQPALTALATVSILATLVLLIGSVAYIAQLRNSARIAVTLQNAANVSAATAREQEELANRHLYAARMREAYELVGRGGAQDVQRLLAPYAPPSPLASLRGFEWYHLKRQIHSERLSLIGHHGEIYTVAYSPDGRVLASGGQDGIIQLWDPDDGRQVASLAGHHACVNGLAYSRDGRTLVSVSCDHTVKIWQAHSHELVTTLEDHPDEVRCLAFSPDGTRLATGGKSSPVVVWDAVTYEMLDSSDPLVDNVDSIAWKDNQHLLFAVGSQILDWNVDTGAKQRIDEPGRIVAISPDGTDMFVGRFDGRVQTLRGSAHMSRLEGNGYSVTALDFLPARNWLAVGSDDASVQIASWPGTEFQQPLSGHTGRIQSLAFAPAGDQLATGSFDGSVKLWDCQFDSLPRIESRIAFPRATTPAHLVALSPDLKYAALPTRSDRVEVFDLDQRKSVATLELRDHAWAMTFGGDASTVYGCAVDAGKIWKWNWRQDRFEFIASMQFKNVSTVAFSRDARDLVVFDKVLSPSVYDAQSGRPWWKLTADIRKATETSIEFSSNPNACWIAATVDLATGDRTRVSQLLDLDARREIETPASNIVALNDRLMAIAERQHATAILERSTGREIARLTLRQPNAPSAFSSDGRTFVTADYRIRQWHVETGQLMSQFKTDSGVVDLLRYSMDGRRLCAVTRDNNVDDGRLVYSTCKLYVWAGTDDP